MSDYKPSSIVVSLCKKLNTVPVAEAIRPDGTVVIVVADGRKLIFAKDGITRTLIGQGDIDLLSKSSPLPTSASRDAEDTAPLERRMPEGEAVSESIFRAAHPVSATNNDGKPRKRRGRHAE